MGVKAPHAGVGDRFDNTLQKSIIDLGSTYILVFVVLSKRSLRDRFDNKVLLGLYLVFYCFLNDS